MSAILNIDISLLNNVNDIKSTTYPLNILSIKLPTAPPNIKLNDKSDKLLSIFFFISFTI